MKTIERSKLSTIGMVSGRERRIHKVIDGGIVRLWVGIGWVDEGPPTRHQKRHLHHVIDEPVNTMQALIDDTVKLWLRDNGRSDDWESEDYMNARQLGELLKKFAGRVIKLHMSFEFKPEAPNHFCSSCGFDPQSCPNNPEVTREKASEEKVA